ncbi:AAA family ATPase [Moraxella osloensis]|nr:AAA family ATPase [Moraxella osloensis]MBW4017086.1 AAA family ATPase [Moraxella osloensis]
MKIFISENYPKESQGLVNSIYLRILDWDDYDFKTNFDVFFIDLEGHIKKIGSNRIGFKNQKPGTRTSIYLERNSINCFFEESLPRDTFSVGVNDQFYKNVMSIRQPVRNNILKSLNDIVFDQSKINSIIEEEVFKISLLRSVSLSEIRGKFLRIINDEVELSKFSFSFIRKSFSNYGTLNLNFVVTPNSTPQTNIHAIIGRNGIGKTTLLNNMVEAIISTNHVEFEFYDDIKSSQIGENYFSRLISVSFSVFDKFSPDKIDRISTTKYYYIGIKNQQEQIKTRSQLNKDFLDSFKECKINGKIELLIECLQNLEEDENFAEMQLDKKITEKNTDQMLLNLVDSLSSGHSIVLLTIIQLVAKVGEKTLVIMDEPEGHLHPPLLSAFIRTLSHILFKNNGVAIIATHSPVVLQEIPRSCVWKIRRFNDHYDASRPKMETFGENVGVLTREVFGLEVERSGFYKILKDEVDSGKSYEQILEKYSRQIGTEGKILIKSMLKNF